MSCAVIMATVTDELSKQNPVTTPRLELEGVIAAFLGDRPPTPGSIHASLHDELPILPELVAQLLGHAAGERPFTAVWVIVLPRSDEKAIRRRVALAVGEGASDDLTLARLVTRAPVDASLAALLEVLAQVPEHAAVIVEGAELYHVLEGDGARARSRAPTPLGVDMSIVFEADEWVPSVCAMAGALRSCAWAPRVHVHLLVGKRPPSTEDHLSDLERALEHFLLVTIDGRPDEAALEPRFAEWCQVLRQCGLDQLRAQVAAYSADPLLRAQVVARCLYLGGRWEEAYRELEPVLNELRDGPPALLNLLAQVSLYAGRFDQTRHFLLAIGACEHVDETTLRNAHKVALQALDEVAKAAVLARMRLDYPRSLYLLRAELIERYLSKDYAAVVDLGARLAGDPELPGYRHCIEWAAYKRGVIDSETLLDLLSVHDPDRLEYFLAELAEEAIAGRRLADALALLRRARPSAPHTNACTLAGCALVQAAGLAPAADIGSDALDLVLRYVSDHAEDIDVFAELTRTLSADQVGSAGWAMLLERLQAAAERPPLPTSAEPDNLPAVDDAAIAAFLGFLHRHYLESGPQALHLRPERIRVDLPVDELLRLMVAGCRVLLFASSQIAGESTLPAAQFTTKAVLDLWCTAAEKGATVPETLPIESLHVLAQGIANAGMLQRARDFAGLMLTYAGSHASTVVKRCGWIGYADIQLRAGRVDAAVIAVLCAQQQPLPELASHECYNELELIIRLLRTLHLYEPALARIPTLRAIVTKAAGAPAMFRKIDDLETGLRLTLLMDECGPEPLTPEQLAELRTLLDTVCRSTEFALAINEEILIPTNLLAQILRECAAYDVDVPAARELFARALAALPPPVAERMRSLASATVDVRALLEFAQVASRARDVADLGAHLEHVRGEAGRLLGRPGTAENALLAIELLADPALAGAAPEELPEVRRQQALQRQLQRGYHFLTHGPRAAPGVMSVPEFVMRGDEVDTRFPTANTLAEPERLRRFACELASGDCEVIALAMGGGRLIHVDARNGRLEDPIIESSPELDGIAVRTWRTNLLQAFAGADGDDPAAITDTETAMRGLGVTAPPAGERTVLYLLTHPLTAVPANLLLRNGGLSGSQSPVAVVPSLSWLLERRVHPTRATGREAWILPAGDDESLGALKLLADNLPPRLPGFGVSLGFPAPEHPLEVAVLAAHGSVEHDGLYFRAVVDEGVQSFSIARVAKALAGCELVILFVCSGGRHDTAPFSSRGVSLPSALLATGCRTVIASPWPLDALVALRWVSVFREVWDVNTDVAVAVHRANMSLMRNHLHPRDFLAMHVFGEPALRPTGEREHRTSRIGHPM